MPSAASTRPAFDIKSTAWTLTAMRLRVADLPTLVAELDGRFADSPGLFDNEPLVVDLGQLRAADAALDWPGLLAQLRRHGMVPIAAQGGSSAQMAAALAAGLAAAPGSSGASSAAPAVTGRTAPSVAIAADISVDGAADAACGIDVVAPLTTLPSGGQAAAPAASRAPAMVIDRPLRSGQRVYARGGDLIIMAMVSFGAEAIADGNIHIYAPLRGRAIAGARGDASARIFSLCLEPQLVSIAGIYRTAEIPWAADVLGRPAQVRLEGERIIVEPLSS